MFESVALDIARIMLVSWEGLNGTAPWLITSFTAAGVIRSILNTGVLQRSLGNQHPSSILKAVASGLLLPVCSCGVIPLGISLYYSGAYIGPTLAFMTSTPITNPAALMLGFGFFGPKLTLLYVVCGLALSVLIGFAGNALAGSELCLESGEPAPEAPNTASYPTPLMARIMGGISWGFSELGPMVSKYVCIGMILMGAIAVLVPQSFIRSSLGNPSMISLAGVAVLGSLMYVCAVGHIPFIAMLVASGAAPGVAVTFLMAGVATNLPEILSIYKLIGRRTAILYFTIVTSGALISGVLVNLTLMPDFVPFMDMEANMRSLRLSKYLSLDPSNVTRAVCSAFVIAMALHRLLDTAARFARSVRQ